MDRQQILDLYEWAPGICFRHPAKGEVPTAVVGVVHPRAAGEKEIRGCADCVMALEDVRRERAARTRNDYRPGPLSQGAE
jgi:hypothetical protein